MDAVKYILGYPEKIAGIGDIWPIKVKDYDTFAGNANLLLLTTHRLELDDSISILDFLVLALSGQEREIVMDGLQSIFSLVTKQDVMFVLDNNDYRFIIDEEHWIDKHNYDDVRHIIMQQNLLFEPRKYKDKLTQQWAELVLKTRAKNSIKMTLEDMITTVSVFTGKTYEQIAEQTLYQLYADFKRISKLKDYDSTVSFKCAGAEKLPNVYFAEEINMFANPYDNIFVNKNKLGQLNDAMK